MVLSANGSWEQLGQPLRRDYERESTFAGEAIYNGMITERGRLLLGGEHSIFSFDGRTWTREEFQQNTFITDFAEDAEGNLWLGANGEIGFYRDFAEAGFSKYISMTDLVSRGNEGVETIFRVILRETSLFFQGHSKVYVWNGKSFQTFTFNSDYRIESFLFEGDYYVSDRDTLFRWDGQDFSSQADFSGKDLGFISSLGRTSEGGLVCLSATGKFFRIRDQGLEFLSQVPRLQNVSESRWTSRGTVLALDTQKGLFEVHPDGTILRLLSVGKELPAGPYQTFISDTRGTVWVLGSFGVSQLALNQPAREIHKTDIPEGGAIQDVSLVGDTLFVATSRGVFHSQGMLSNGSEEKFEKISSVGTGLRFIPTPDGRLLQSRLGGIIALNKRGVQGLSTPDEEKLYTDVKPSQVDPDWDILLDRYQLYLASRTREGWTFLDKISHQADYPLQISEPEPGILYLSDPASGLVKIQYHPQGRFLSRTEFDSIGDHGLLGKAGLFG